MKNKSERAITRVVITTGISSVVTQLLTIREFLALFSGNEFVIALILFSWLILGGLGTLLARPAGIHPSRATLNRLALLSFLLAALSPVQIMVIRVLRDIFFIHGASVGFYPTFAFTFCTIAPYCLILGFVLPYSLFVIRAKNPDYPGIHIYMSDNLGDVAGGALFSFALVFLFTPMQALAFANLPLAVCTFLIFKPPSQPATQGVLFTAATLAVLVMCVYFEKPSLAPEEGGLAFYKESRYGRITVHKDREQFTLFMEGRPVFSSINIRTAEEAVHYPLSQIEKKDHILMISARAGMMGELAKHHPRTVDYVELDPALTSVLFEFNLIQKIPALHVIHRDGRAFLSETDKTFDAILLNLPEPETFQLNRFYTSHFFDLVSRRLSPDGIFCFSIQGYDNYLAEPQRRKLSSIHNTVSMFFPHILMLPGEKIYFLCGNRPIEKNIPARLKKMGISTAYISSYFYGNLTDRRIDYLSALVDPEVPRNTDDSPRLMNIMFSQWFAKFTASPKWFIITLIVFTGMYLFRITREEFVLFSTGCMTMGSEILVIFAFQVVFGYIYFQIGMIVTVFLAGLLPGAWLGEKLSRQGRNVLVLTDCMLIFLTVIFILVFTFGKEMLTASSFLLFGFSISLLCGFQFPAAFHLRGADNVAAVHTFSADLIGAAIGTLITSIVLIPYAGILWTASGLIFLKLISLIIMVNDNGNKP